LRYADRKFLVEGPQAVREAIDARAGGDHRRAERGALLELFVTEDGRSRHLDLVGRAAQLGVPVRVVPPEALEPLTDTVSPQGIVGVARMRHLDLAALEPKPLRLVAVLGSVRDPGNAGTVLRVADAAGADAVVFSAGSVDPYNGKCVRASAGSLFHLPFVVGAELGTAVELLRRRGLQILAADAGGDCDLDDLADGGQLGRPTAWLFGNEAWGLPEESRRLADAVVRVPIHGRAESLNLATAAAVCLYSSARALRAPRGLVGPRNGHE
jgi:TrmH family RNA methyltransferase